MITTKRVTQVKVPRPVKWKLVWDSEKMESINLNKDEIYLIRKNLKMIWMCKDAIRGKLPALYPISRRLHLDYIAIIQGDKEVLLCKTDSHFK